MATPKGLITRDSVRKVIGAVTEVAGKHVLVGIPESRDARDDGPMTNAALGYIHEFGSPEANIPARPFLVPGVRKAQDQIGAQLKAAFNAALDGNQNKADASLNAAGIAGANGTRQEISTGAFEPLKPSTIRNRRRSRGTASMRQAEQDYLAAIAAGSGPQAAQDAAGIRPLINTGQLRNALTYVVRKK